ncbi:MAG: pseudouridine synthase [Minicystis sp.]
MQERLQKIIARAGVTSRRAGEELIQSGRVRVNGRIVTELGAKADPRADAIEVDGRRLVAEAPRYIVLHKPRNVVSTLQDPEGRPTVAELLSAAGTRLYPVGRLDFATSGVLLATNDGDFANGLLHPRGGVPKTYVLKVKGLMSEEDLERWARGVDLEDGRTLPATVRLLRHEEDKTWFEITIREGRNQQIRRMGEATGFPVMRLARTSFAGVTHEGLRPGDFRSLTVEELESLRKQFGVPKRIRGAVLGEHGEAAGHRPRRPSRGAGMRDEGRGERRAAPGRGERRHGPGQEEASGERRWPAARGEARGERRAAAAGEAYGERRRPPAREERGRPAAHEGARGSRGRPAPRDEAHGERRPVARGERGRPAPRDEAHGERRPVARGERGRSGAREEVREQRGRSGAREDVREQRGRPVAREDARADRRRPPARDEARADRRRPPAREDAARGPAPRPGREAPKGAGGDRPPRRRRG